MTLIPRWTRRVHKYPSLDIQASVYPTMYPKDDGSTQDTAWKDSHGPIIKQLADTILHLTHLPSVDVPFRPAPSLFYLIDN